MTNRMKTATFILGAMLMLAIVFAMAFALVPNNAPTAQAEPIVTFGKVTSEDQITAENIGECTFEDMKAWVGSHWDGIFDGVDEYTNVLFVYAVESGYKGSSFCKANFASGEDFATSNRVGSGTISSIDQVKESYQLDGDVVYLCGFEVAAAAAPSAIKLTGVPDEWTEANDKYWDEGNFVEPYHEYFYSSFTQDELPGFIPCTKEEANEWSAPTEEFTVLIFALNDGVCSYRIINSGKKDGICEDTLRRVDIFDWFNNGRNIYYTGEAVIEYPLYVGDTQVTDGNMDDVFGDGTVRFTPADETTPATLTLNGLTLSTYSGEAIETYGIYWNDTAALNIVLTADTVNTVSPSGAVYGIYSNGAVIISGEGTLTAAGTESSGATGLDAKGLTIDGATVDISGAYGIKCAGYTVTISGGVVTAKGDFGAVRGNVINAIPGTGWTNKAGTEGEAAIAVSTEGQTLDYKKVTFAAHEHAYGEDITDESYYTCDCGEVDAERKAAYDSAQEVTAAESKIDAIGEVVYTSDSKAKIDAAREAFDALSDTQKAAVTNAGALTAAESKYASLKADHEAADAVKALITAIGTVEYTDACKTKIDAARAAYDALTAEQKALVDNYGVLTAAEARYAALKADADAAAEVIDLIESIGTVEYTAESKAKIDAAMAAFGNLTEEQKLLVANKAELPTAENTYDSLADQAKAQSVKELIGAIGTVKYPDSKEPIKSARTAYDALTAGQKALVDNYSVLTAAESAYADLEAAAHAPAEEGFDIGWIAFIFGMLVLAYFAAVVVLTKVYRKDGKRLSFIGLMASAAVIIAAIVILAVNPSVVSAISFLLCAIDALLFIFFGIGYGQDDDEKDEVIR